MKNRNRLLGLIGLLVSAVFVWLAFRGIEFAELAHLLRNANWWWAVPAVAVYFLGHVFRGLRSAIILRPHTKIGWPRAMNLILIGYAANNVLPARLGELIRTVILGRLQKMSKATALSTVFVERIFDGMAIVAILYAITLWHPLPPWAVWLGRLGGAVFLGAFVSVLGVTLLRDRFLKLLSRILTPFPKAGVSKLLEILERLMLGIDFLQPGSALVAIFLLSACVWIAEGTMFAMVLPMFDLEIPRIAAWFATSVTNLGIALPSSPGYVGTFHEFCKESLKVFGADEARALAFAITVHALHYIPVTLTGLIALHAYGFRLGSVTQETEEKKATP